MSSGFEGRIAIVGGSSSGLGFAVAEMLAKNKRYLPTFKKIKL